MVQFINDFTINKIHRKREDAEIESCLYHRGRNTGVILLGVSLEAQFKFKDKFILFLTEDCPFEECLFIYLLDQDFTLLDRAGIFIQFTPGILGDLKIENDHEISFTFFSNDEKWTMNILPETKRVLTHGFKVPVRRPFSLFGKRYFELRWEEQIKKPA